MQTLPFLEMWNKSPTHLATSEPDRKQPTGKASLLDLNNNPLIYRHHGIRPMRYRKRRHKWGKGVSSSTHAKLCLFFLTCDRTRLAMAKSSAKEDVLIAKKKRAS